MARGGQGIPRNKGLRKRANKGASAKRGEFKIEGDDNKLDSSSSPRMTPVCCFCYYYYYYYY